MPDARGTRQPAHAFALACAMIVSAVATPSFVVLAAIGALGVLAMIARRVPLSRLLARLRATAFIVGGAILIGALASPAHAVRSGALLAGRVLDAALWGTWLVATCSPLEIDEALHALGAPRGIVALLALTRRFGAQLRSTMQSAWNANALRGGFRTPRITALVRRNFDRRGCSWSARNPIDRPSEARPGSARGGDGALFAGERRFAWSSWVALAAVVGLWSVAGRTWGRP